ncbi:LysR family transcriptional regulator [Cedecea neteri]|uniref:LysR family transcriptional regulator n=1 Tax=Cedecea neteri TaxID=158822 RepID=A0A2X3JFW9_9ENTR|nr:LysR family transcriptional regulator [Cedecea neteri]
MSFARCVAAPGSAPRYHVEQALSEGRLVEVMADWQKPAIAVSAVYTQNRQLSPRVRVFIDWLKEIYSARFPAGAKT